MRFELYWCLDYAVYHISIRRNIANSKKIYTYNLGGASGWQGRGNWPPVPWPCPSPVPRPMTVAMVQSSSKYSSRVARTRGKVYYLQIALLLLPPCSLPSALPCCPCYARILAPPMMNNVGNAHCRIPPQHMGEVRQGTYTDFVRHMIVI